MKLKVTCPHCAKLTELDSAKVPDKPVTFACPSCHGKVPIDGRKLKAQHEAPTPPAPAQATPTPAPPTHTVSAGAGDAAVADALEQLELPDDLTLPSGIVVGGEEDGATEQLQQVLGRYGCNLRSCASVADAQVLASLHLPPLIFSVCGTVGAPPLAELEPLTGIPSDERRRTFIVLIGDNLKTLDGNAAFFHNVDLVMSRRDLGKADRVLYAALQFRDKLCASFFEALAAVEG